MNKSFVVYQALGAACKKYAFLSDEKAELWKRVFKDKPYERADSNSHKYRAVMGYAKQLRKELDERSNSIEMLHAPESEAVITGVIRPVSEIREAKAKLGLLRTTILISKIMEEL